MTQNDMANLILAYDGYQQLKSVLGCGKVGFGFSDGIFGKLERIETVICDTTEHLSTEERVEILDGGGSAEERARKLLGGG